MKTEISIHLRAFCVRVSDPTHGERDEVIVLDKSQLQAAQLVGQSSKELSPWLQLLHLPQTAIRCSRSFL